MPNIRYQFVAYQAYYVFLFCIGKKGVGLGKRPLSPGAADRSAKSAKVVEDSNKEDYRHRTREEYEERRAVGRLMRATVTLLALDEQAGVEVRLRQR